MIVVDPEKRLSARECLDHSWLQGSIQDISLDPVIVKRMMKFNRHSLLKRAALLLLVNSLNAEDTIQETKQFEKIDTSGDYFIDADELKGAIHTTLNTINDGNIYDQVIANLIEKLDYNGDGKIGYKEFLSAAIDTEKFLNEENLKFVY